MKRTKNQKRIALSLLAGMTLLPAALKSQAQTATYGATRRQIKACVLFASSNSALFNPYAFYELDARTDLRPGEWDIINPLAPSTVSGAGFRRWQYAGFGNNNGKPNSSTDGSFQENAPLAKNMAPYWEVNLDTISDDDLRKMDIALLPMAENNANVKLSDGERERLRRFVDGGGTLWIELDPPKILNGTPMSGITNFIFSITSGGPGGSSKLSSYHPLLNFPNKLSNFDLFQIAGLGSGAGSFQYDLKIAPGIPPPYMSPILGGADTTLAAGDYGAGHIILSAAPIATNINSEITLNSGRVNLRSAPKFDSALKMVANMIAWTTAAPTQGGNARRTGSTGERIGAQLGEKWTWTPATGAAKVSAGSGAVIYKSLVFYVDSANILHVFDRDPAQHFLGNQSADDGYIKDFQYGAPYDEICNAPTELTGRVSTPTVATVTEYGNSSKTGDYVAVTSDAGDTAIFLIRPYKATNGDTALELVGAGGYKHGGGGGLIEASAPVPSPVYSEGLFFATTTQSTNGTVANSGTGRIVALGLKGGVFANAFTLTNSNAKSDTAVAPFPGDGNNPSNAVEALPTLRGPIAAGYIKDNASGALDKIIYATTVPPVATNGVAANTSVLGALWFSTKNEPLTGFLRPGTDNNLVAGTYQAFHADGQRGNVPWYLNASDANDPLNPVIRITHASGPPTSLRYGDTGSFLVYTEVNSTERKTQIELPNAIAATDLVYADYTLNWPGTTGINAATGGGAVPMTNADMKTIGRAFSPAAPNLANNGGDTKTYANIIGGPVITAQDTAIFNSTFDGGANGMTGRIYGLREQYGSATSQNTAVKEIGTQIAWTYSPEPSRGTITNTLTRLFDRDSYGGIGSYNPLNQTDGTYCTQFTPVGSPALLNDTVYVVGTTRSPAATVIMALRANPSMTITLGAVNGLPQPIPQGYKVEIFNRTAQASDGSVSNWFANAPHLTKDAQFVVDPDSGNITIYDCTLSGGNVLNLGEPIVIGIQPTVATNAQGTSVTPPPIVISLPNPTDINGVSPLDNLAWYMIIPQNGNINYVPKKLQGIVPSSGPSIIGETLYFSTTNGGIASVDLRGSGGQHTLHIVNPPPTGGTLDNTDGNLRVHLMMPLPPNGQQGGPGMALEPPTGTERTLVMGLPGGVSAFDARPTLIADASRIMEVDYGGNALWTMDATLAALTANSGESITTKTTLARPSVAHRIGLDQFFIADTNNNRVTLADRGGSANFELTTFNNDMGFVAPGYPLTLNAPTDAQFLQDAPNKLIVFSSPKGTYTYNGNNAVINRYLIADSGNFRLLEIVDVLDADTGQPVIAIGPNGSKVTMQRQVSFVSKSLGEQNLKHRYRSIQEFAVPDPNNPNNPTVYIVSAIGNTARGVADSNATLTASGSNQEGLGGSVEILRRDLNNYALDGTTYRVFTNLKLITTQGGKAITSYVPLNNVTFCKGFYNSSADSNAMYPLNQFAYEYMIADGNGCYVVNENGVILWMLTSDQYFSMTGRPLRASSIQRLTQADLNPIAGDSRPWYPRFLITNRYEGPDALPELLGGKVTRGQIHGEVFEIRSLNYEVSNTNNGFIYTSTGSGFKLNLGDPNFPNLPITWLFPNERPTSFVVKSALGSSFLYGVERLIGNTTAATSTSLLQQPTSAERPN